MRRSSFAAGGRRRTGSVFRGSGVPSAALAPLVSGVPSDFSAPATLDDFGRRRSRSIGRPLGTAEGRHSAALLRRESVRTYDLII